MRKIRQLRFRAFVSASVFFVLLLAIVLLWYYRDDLFQTIYDPGQPFQTYVPPAAPDYNDPSGWLLRPDLSLDPIHEKHQGDVFVVTPTMYLGGQHWNAPLENARYKRDTSLVSLPNFVLPYQSAGRVFAPRYRQASLYSFMTNREDAQAAQNFAYQDIRRAFEQFRRSNPPERPIILIGHGQGGLHIQRLLMEYFKGDAATKLAAAYIIDHPLPLDSFETGLRDLKPCATVEDTNCVVAFGIFTAKESDRARMFVEKTMVWEGRGLKATNGRPLLCINPLLWTQSTDYAPARLHLGGVAAEGLDESMVPAPAAKQTGAQCADGLLMTEKPKQKSLRRPNRFGGRYRTNPFNLFYEDLRVDMDRRVNNLIAKDILPTRAPLLELEVIEVDEAPVGLPQKLDPQ